jgi:hypothetical protein
MKSNNRAFDNKATYDLINNKLSSFLDNWQEMDFFLDVSPKGVISLAFNIVFVKSTQKHVKKSNTPYRAFTSADVFEINNNVMFLENHFN